MKIGFAAIHGLLVVTAAYFGVDIMYKKILPDRFEIPVHDTATGAAGKTTGPDTTGRMTRDQYDTIIKRNIFNVDLEPEKQNSEGPDPDEVPVEKLEPTELKLVLWGTVTGADPVYAVIEDKKTREQSLYEIGDRVQEASVKKIMRHGVVLHYNGKDQILEMEDQTKAGSVRPTKAPPVSGSVPVPSVLNKAFPEGSGSDELSSLMKEVKIRPHFSEGEADGLMVYGIRPNSVFRKIGLRNGDIIKDINGRSIARAEDALNLYTEIKESDNARITLMRRGKEQEIQYHVRDGEYSLTAVSDQEEEPREDAGKNENTDEKQADADQADPNDADASPANAGDADANDADANDSDTKGEEQ